MYKRAWCTCARIKMEFWLMLRSNGTGPIFFTEFLRSFVPFCSHNPIIGTVQNFRRLAVQSLPVNTAKISRLFTVLFFPYEDRRDRALYVKGSHLAWVSRLLRGRGAVWEEARKYFSRYNPRRPPPWYIWKTRWPSLTVDAPYVNDITKKIGDCEHSRKYPVKFFSQLKIGKPACNL